MNCLHGSCKSSSTHFECKCHSGWARAADGICSVDIDECATKQQSCQHRCQNTPGSFTCSCDAGFVLADDGVTCHDVDECLGDNECQQQCKNDLGSYHCECFDGYVMENGACREMDICSQAKCSHQCRSIGTAGFGTHTIQIPLSLI